MSSRRRGCDEECASVRQARRAREVQYNHMDVAVDTYGFRARVLPVYLSFSPAVLLLAAVAPDDINLPLGGAAAIAFAPISFLLGQIGADFGKHLEKRLWREWGGPPTTRFLRHGNREFNEVTRRRVHGKLRALGLVVPTHEEQKRDERAADEYYQSCTEELIRRTRDQKKYPLVFKGLVEYGFRRNLLGLKAFGVVLAVTSLAGAGWCTYADWSAAKPPVVAVVAGLITMGLLVVWITWVKERTVKLAANRYARFIMEGALDQK